MAYQRERDAIRAGQLIHKEINGKLSEGERIELQRWVGADPSNGRAYNRIKSEEGHRKTLEALHQYNSADSLAKLLPQLNDRQRIRPGKLYLGVAAALLVVFSVSLGIYLRNQNTSQRPMLTSKYGDDALPGGNHAILTFADGSSVQLDSLVTGSRLSNNGTTIIKTADGQITYEKSGGEANVAYNKIITPPGGEYQIILPDSTTVWMNAGSELSYPTKFTGNERRVQLIGEAYFDVAHRDNHTFIVQSGKQEVQVLGTQFNINAYPNEPQIQTSLVKGRVKVSDLHLNRSVTLQPGQRSVSTPRTLHVEDADISPDVAWKDGDFKFDGTPLPQVLRQLERWYDIEVDYSHIPHDKIHGAISRDRKLSSILFTIEQVSSLEFTLSEGRLTLRE